MPVSYEKAPEENIISSKFLDR